MAQAQSQGSAHAYLTPRALKGLTEYQYKSGGLTWLDHLHNPVWNALVDKLPMWLAPNLITLTGMVFVVSAYLLSIVYSPNFSGDSPQWLYWFMGISVFMYVNLDCMDGKQARRTGSSSPLGQLFDHGCDALSLHLLLDSVRTSLELDNGLGAVTMEMAIMVPWMLAHWEEYHTGLMLYGNGWVGVLEGNYALVLCHLVSAIAGPKAWHQRILPAGVLPVALEGLNTWRNGLLFFAALMAVWSAVGQVYRVLVFRTATLSEQEAGHKQLGHGAAFTHITYICLVIALGWVYLTASPTETGPIVEGLKGLVVYHSRVRGATWGLVYALIASQLILAHMCKEPFIPYAWALAVLALGCINTQINLAPALLFDLLLMSVTFMGYCHFVGCSISQICQHLGIHCLRIKKRPEAKIQ